MSMRPPHEIARRLAVSSLEVDRVIDVGVADVGDNLSYLRVGKVLAADKHPNADKLQLCQLDVGEGEPRQIVCGAWNFGVGATVAVGLPGVLLPGFPAPLDERQLRGEVSRGMILAEDEIGLGSDHAGIMLLADGIEPGTPLADVLPVHEQVLDVTPTMNRVDLLSMVGLAREVATLFDGELKPVDGRRIRRSSIPTGSRSRSRLPRRARATSARVHSNVTVGPSPMWLRARLHAAGMRSISNVVDITNYVMHVYGSPLHAFDRARLAGGRIAVRYARAGEEVTTLDGTLRRVDEGDLLITDGEKPVALAAIMGGADSEVTAGDDRGTARGGELRADRDLANVGAARPPHGGIESLGEGCRPVSRRACRDPGQPADRRSRGRRAGRCRRYARRAARAAPRPAPAGHGPTGSSGWRSRRDEQRSILERLGFECLRRRGMSRSRPGGRAT